MKDETTEIDEAAAWYEKEMAPLEGAPNAARREQLISLHGRADGRFGCDVARQGWRQYQMSKVKP